MVVVSPLPTVGDISMTRYTQPDELIAILAALEPGKTTIDEVRQALRDGGSTPDILFDDIVSYDPPAQTTKSSRGVVVDDELLRACRAGRDDAHLLVWCALQMADKRLDFITREVLTDPDGRLVPEMINRTRLYEELESINSSHGGDFPHGDKTTTNILRLLDKCRLLVPNQHGQTIIGIGRTLPTAHAVPALLVLIPERLARFATGVEPDPNAIVEFALGLGANHWLNLTADEFRAAALGRPEPGEPRERGALPEDLVELDDQLTRRRQVVLQGAPGVGKTFLARRYIGWATAGASEESRLQAIIDDLPQNERTPEDIAREIVRRGLSAVWDIVQFHPGYDYTDFVRALVAEPVQGGVTFVPRHRIFSFMCAVGEALAELQTKPVDQILVLDEINRGDIANIFGELLFALEYRDEAVATPYAVDGSTSITVPSSLKLIGTMNTADRSIAVIDYALRRRFVFLDLPASDEPLRTWGNYGADEVKLAALYLYDRTAAALEGGASGLQVGPSYYLLEAEGEEQGLRMLASRYVYEVLPLLTEYELEGEIEAAQLAALRDLLSITETSQRTSAAALAAHLAEHPWSVAVGEEATPDATGEAGPAATGEPSS